MLKKKFWKVNIYVFGLLSNLIPLVGLMVVYIPTGIDNMHLWQAVAWICGGTYYAFMWSVALIVYKKMKTQNKTLEERIESLEKQMLEKQK